MIADRAVSHSKLLLLLGWDGSSLKNGFDCDDAACVARSAHGAIVSVARTAHGLVEDCRHADLVVTPRTAPPDCRAYVMDRHALREGGSAAIERTRQGWRIERAVPPGTDRPWAHAQTNAPVTRLSLPD